LYGKAYSKILKRRMRTMFESRIKGKRLLGLGMALALLVTAGIWQVSERTGHAQSTGGFNGAKVVAEGLSFTTLSTAASAPASTPFYTEAPLFVATRGGSNGCFVRDGGVGTTDKVDPNIVGRVRVWGVSAGGGALAVNVTIELPGYNGVLVGQGTLFGVIVDALHSAPAGCSSLGDDIIVITGGSSGFRGASGEASFFRQPDGSLVIRLQETPRRGGDLDIDFLRHP
jgi:hypothetical protein